MVRGGGGRSTLEERSATGSKWQNIQKIPTTCNCNKMTSKLLIIKFRGVVVNNKRY
jgi:hypothetical protein